MSGKQIMRYLTLTDRYLFILLHSGVDWKPEYGLELEAIKKELAELRVLIDGEHQKRREVSSVSRRT